MPPEKILDSALHRVPASGFKLGSGGVGTVDVRETSWDSIGGLEEVKQRLRMAIEMPMSHPEAFERMDIRPSKGCLLYGPPGMNEVFFSSFISVN